MLKYSKDQKISLNLTLVNNDGTPEDNATISYKIYNSSNTLELSGSPTYNNQLGSYIDIIDPTTEWLTQDEGIYYVKWEISGTIEDYPNIVTEELYIESISANIDTINNQLDTLTTNTESISANIESISANIDTEFDNVNNQLDTITTNTESISGNIDLAQEKLDRILGLIHENMIIDNPVYDKFDNLQSARLRIYSDSSSVGTNSNIIGEYEIYADTTNTGKFNYWMQKRIS